MKTLDSMKTQLIEDCRKNGLSSVSYLVNVSLI